MHPQLEILLQIQDLKSQRRELRENEGGRAMEEQEFNIDIDDAIGQLDARIDELKEDLPPQVRGRLDRFAKTGGRAVVPVINGICYGCFTAVATGAVADLGRNDNVNYCESCGRFLYVVPG
ncbi:MAG TPA: C4-type zinc ribbon domain-containing protein [Longimicrobiales bacterium]|nr:C4-type zinc ribbon domain-containing protein [Longimicrobiales bacterium]